MQPPPPRYLIFFLFSFQRLPLRFCFFNLRKRGILSFKVFALTPGVVTSWQRTCLTCKRPQHAHMHTPQVKRVSPNCVTNLWGSSFHSTNHSVSLLTLTRWPVPLPGPLQLLPALIPSWAWQLTSDGVPQVLQNIPLHCVRMCHCDCLSKKLNGQKLGRKRLGGASGDRGKKAGSPARCEKAGAQYGEMREQASRQTVD